MKKIHLFVSTFVIVLMLSVFYAVSALTVSAQEVTLPLSVDSITVNKSSPQYVGNSIQLTMETSGGVGDKQYLFYYCLNGIWKNIDSYCSSNTTTWTPQQAGTYTIYAETMDENSTKAYRSITYTINPMTLDSFTMVNNGAGIQLTAQANGGIGNKRYLFYYCLNGNWANINAYSSNNTVTWKPSAVGTYTVYAESMDDTGTKAYKTMTYTVKPISMDTFTMSNDGTSVQLSAQSNNGVGAKRYLFYYCLNGNWVNINTYSSSNTATWTPPAVGTYTVYAESMDDIGTKAYQTMTYTVKPISMDAFTMSNNGTSVQLSAQVNNGVGAKRYLFYYCLNGNWVNISTYSSSNTATWTPSAVGTYTIYAESMDATGTKALKAMTYTVKPNSMETFTASVSGANVQLAAQANNGVGAKRYLFYYCLNGNWANINAYSSSNTATWTPSAVGTYTVYAESMDDTNTKAWKAMTYTVKPNSMETFTASVSGANVQLTAQANNGVGAKRYLFYYCLNGNWANINAYSSSNTATWTPSAVGTYTIYAESMDDTNTKAWKALNFTVTRLAGVDVSEHRGTINWDAAKNNGVQFAIIRCGFGDNYAKNIGDQDDTQFERNVQECERLGIPWGTYLYSYAANVTGTEKSAESEYQHIMRLLQGKHPTLPVYIDMEKSTGGNYVAIADYICGKLTNSGYLAGVYANLDWWDNYLNDSCLDKYERWVAQYYKECQYDGAYGIWQYASDGSVNGISGNVDMDYCYKQY